MQRDTLSGRYERINKVNYWGWRDQVRINLVGLEAVSGKKNAWKLDSSAPHHRNWNVALASSRGIGQGSESAAGGQPAACPDSILSFFFLLLLFLGENRFLACWQLLQEKKNGHTYRLLPQALVSFSGRRWRLKLAQVSFILRAVQPTVSSQASLLLTVFRYFCISEASAY